MEFSWILLLLAGLPCLLVEARKDRQYCIIGAGPAGVCVTATADTRRSRRTLIACVEFVYWYHEELCLLDHTTDGNMWGIILKFTTEIGKSPKTIVNRRCSLVCIQPDQESLHTIRLVLTPTLTGVVISMCEP